MNQVVLHLGSNQGSRELILGDAILAITRRLGSIIKASDIYETAAWGRTKQADFLNLACWCETPLSAQQILRECQSIETEQGRQRLMHWGPRTLDIDLIFFNTAVIDTPSLTIPHPRMMERRFVLQPLADIIPDWVHPKDGRTVAALLTDCNDDSKVWLWET